MGFLEKKSYEGRSRDPPNHVSFVRRESNTGLSVIVLPLTLDLLDCGGNAQF